MLTIHLARRIRDAGVLWEPAPGDRFTIDRDTVAGEVFWISHLTIDVHVIQGQPVLGFNGTEVINANQLINLISMTPVGRPADLVVWRGKRKVPARVVIVDRDVVVALEPTDATTARTSAPLRRPARPAPAPPVDPHHQLRRPARARLRRGRRADRPRLLPRHGHERDRRQGRVRSLFPHLRWHHRPLGVALPSTTSAPVDARRDHNMHCKSPSSMATSQR